MGREQETKRTDLVDNTLQLFQLLRSVRYDEIDNIVPEVIRVRSFLIIADFEMSNRDQRDQQNRWCLCGEVSWS